MSIYFLETVVLGAGFWMVRNLWFDDLSAIGSIVVSICLGGCWAAIFVAINIKKLLSNWKDLNASKAKE